MHRIMMGLVLGVVALVGFQASFDSTHTTQAAVPDNRGTEFVLGLNTSLSGSVSSNKLFVGADEATTVTVSVPGIGFGPADFAVAPGTITSIGLPLSARMAGSGSIENKGILVTAPKEIFLYGLNYGGASADGFLGLPVDVQGSDYLIPSYSNVQGASPSELGVVGISDDTTVTITPSFASQPGSNTPPTVPAATPFSITLNRLQTFQLSDAGIDSTGDLTGSVITSDKPISVFGAHYCANVPVGVLACDHLVEQIPPTSTWGTAFLTVPLATRTGGDLFRILASQDGTDVMLDGTPLGTINRGQFIETGIPSTTFARITSGKPVLVVQYSKGSAADGKTKSDPFMMIVPPIAQFAPAYTFSTPASAPVIYESFTNYVNIVAPSAELSGILLDGNAVSSAWTAIGASGYSGTRAPVNVGIHTVSHTSSVVAIGIYVYGYSTQNGYGYPGGMRLATIANQPAGSIEICKQTDPPGGTGFGFGGTTPSFTVEPFVLDDGGCFSTAIGSSPGPYTFTESPTPGLALTGISCTGGVTSTVTFEPGGASTFSTGDTGVTISPTPGENVTCTFTNTQTCAAPVGLDISTGTDGLGLADSRWMLTYAPAGSGLNPPTTAYGITALSGWATPPPPLPLSPPSHWIHPDNTGNYSGSDSQLAGYYVYERSFTVPYAGHLFFDYDFAADNDVSIVLVKASSPSDVLATIQPALVAGNPSNFSTLHPTVPDPYPVAVTSPGLYILRATVNNHPAVANPSQYTQEGFLLAGTVKCSSNADVGGLVTLTISNSSPSAPWVPLSAIVASVISVLGVAIWCVARGVSSSRRRRSD